ncbi:hypothetical protein [Vibrio owensii]|uniref:hypothetical protein n=1 Tax=Vibrio owensii TaxID=696485 RepID=UPI0018F16A6E|nr:hypothetical protein [Vibrio owensii]
MLSEELSKFATELKGLIDRDVKVTQIFGEYISLSADGLALIKVKEEKAYFNMNCSCGEPSCEIGLAVKRGLTAYEELDLNAAGRGFYHFGDVDNAGKKRLCVDILACANTHKKISKDQMLVKKGSINRKLSIRLGRIGVFTVSDLQARSVAAAYHDLKDAYPKDTLEKHLFEMYSRILNKNCMFLTPEEKSSIKAESNAELSRRVRVRIEASRPVSS